MRVLFLPVPSLSSRHTHILLSRNAFGSSAHRFVGLRGGERGGCPGSVVNCVTSVLHGPREGGMLMHIVFYLCLPSLRREFLPLLLSDFACAPPSRLPSSSDPPSLFSSEPASVCMQYRTGLDFLLGIIFLKLSGNHSSCERQPGLL